MNISIKQLRAFIAVAQTGSFTEASDRVHLSQPALSIAIRNLEQAVGGTLLVRSTRVLALTPEGEQFLPVALRLLQDWDGALDDLHNLFALKRGLLTVAAMPSFAGHQLPSALAEYRQSYPAVRIRVQDVVAEEAVAMVASGQVEMAVAFELDCSDDLAFEPLYTDNFVAVLPPEHPLLDHSTLNWPQLADSPFLTLQAPSMIRQMVLDIVAEHQLALNIEFESHQLVTIIRMVVCGLGVSVVPSLCIPQIEQQGAEWRPIQQPQVARQVGIYTRKRYPLSSAASAMIPVLHQIAGRPPA
ncbi:LysR family transcriptional regulator [Motiliproteus coralliicola]|uniref:LysR family transcriptional regulator n=1 Tax=Motiliproteus coralliicola TaxID=2283196 RepID=UPI001FB41E45|nr:LysR family transcriptional regulator [Motiliproteus coralliicola]